LYINDKLKFCVSDDYILKNNESEYIENIYFKNNKMNNSLTNFDFPKRQNYKMNNNNVINSNTNFSLNQSISENKIVIENTNINEQLHVEYKILKKELLDNNESNDNSKNSSSQNNNDKKKYIHKTLCTDKTNNTNNFTIKQSPFLSMPYNVSNNINIHKSFSKNNSQELQDVNLSQTWPVTNLKNENNKNNSLIIHGPKQHLKSIGNRKKKFLDALDSEKKSYCINCGKYGHLFKKCIYPILSFGLIGYHYDVKSQNINFIMIQSKNTFHFLDFIRGKYDILDIDCLHKLFINMTPNEIEMIKSKNFDLIWKETYHDIYILNDIQENQKKISKAKFDFLNQGFLLANNFYNLNYFLELNKNSKIEISWSFPKGRRNYKESDLMCAIREFEEETGIKRKYFEIKEPKKIYCETYIGDNNIEYQHRYFLAEFHQKIELEINCMNSHQMIEIGMLKWLNKDDALKNINTFYKQRIDIVNQFISDILENKKKIYNRKNNSFIKNTPPNHKLNSHDRTDKISKQPFFHNIFDNSKAYLSNNQNTYIDYNNEDDIFPPN
jgi:8-oxo-dGTP pyrophosphatase MutT (NUDIX family)